VGLDSHLIVFKLIQKVPLASLLYKMINGFGN